MAFAIDDLFPIEFAENLLNEALGRSALFIQGKANKIAPLISWENVSHLLTFGGLGFPRVRLIKENTELPANAYSYMAGNGFPRLLVAELTTLLRSGAILAIDSIEQLHEPVSLLCQALEKVLRVAVQVDLYCALESAPPGSPGQGEHESLIFQVRGRKGWELYRPAWGSAASPTGSGAPEDAPTWEGILGPGDFLYVPRRWWYRDGSLEEPSLYLVATFRTPTMKDAIQRVLGRLNPALMQTDLPRSTDFKGTFLARMQQEVADRCGEAGVVLGLLRELRQTAEPRICFDLPQSVIGQTIPEGYIVVPLVRFPCADTTVHRAEDKCVEIFHTGRWVRFEEDAAIIMNQLFTNPGQSVGELVEACGNAMLRTRVTNQLAELVKHGILAVREPRDIGQSDGVLLGVS
jgi:hypothetical protein